MKISGKKVEGPSRKTVIIKRETGDLKFTFEAVLNEDEFTKLCPRPNAHIKLLPGGKKVPDYQHPEYQKALEDWAELKTAWTFLKSVSATEGLEWESVDLSNPNTWKNYRTELEAAGLSNAEQLRLLDAYIYVNGLDEYKIDESVQSFLAGPQEIQEN